MRTLASFVLCSAGLLATGCFVAREPEETCLPYVGVRWCAELADASYQDAAGGWHELTDPESGDDPMACACLMPEQADDLEAGLANPGAPPMGYEAARAIVLDAAVAHCESLAGDAPNDCASVTPTFTEDGPCIDEYCELADGGDEAGSGNAPPPELGIASWSQALSCDGNGSCTVDAGVAAAIEVDPTLLAWDGSRFAAGVSPLRKPGMQLVLAPSGSLAGALGLEVGDVVVSANGWPLDGFDDVLSATGALVGSQQIALEVHRGRVARQHVYTRGMP
mgnify:CR=1 FL=1